MGQLIIRRGKTLEQIEAELRDFDHPTIYYAAHTCWWTHNPAHLARTGKEGDSIRLPCDPRGSVLFMTSGELSSALGFITAARSNAAHYGKHGLHAFVAAHHESSFDKTSGLPWSERRWLAYNDALDAMP